MAYVNVFVSPRKCPGAIRKPLLYPSELRGRGAGTYRTWLDDGITRASPRHALKAHARDGRSLVTPDGTGAMNASLEHDDPPRNGFATPLHSSEIDAARDTASLLALPVPMDQHGARRDLLLPDAPANDVVDRDLAWPRPWTQGECNRSVRWLGKCQESRPRSEQRRRANPRHRCQPAIQEERCLYRTCLLIEVDVDHVDLPNLGELGDIGTQAVVNLVAPLMQRQARPPTGPTSLLARTERAARTKPSAFRSSGSMLAVTAAFCTTVLLTVLGAALRPGAVGAAGHFRTSR